MGCVFLSQMGTPSDSGLNLTSQSDVFASTGRPLDVLVLLTIAGIADIPVGYVIYQAYQAQFHRFHVGWLPLETAPHVDRGYAALRLLPFETRLAIARGLDRGQSRGYRASALPGLPRVFVERPDLDRGPLPQYGSASRDKVRHTIGTIPDMTASPHPVDERIRAAVSRVLTKGGYAIFSCNDDYYVQVLHHADGTLIAEAVWQ